MTHGHVPLTRAIRQFAPDTVGGSASYTISDSSNEFVALYDYNAYNQLTGVDTKGVKTDYVYFADGMRKSKNAGGELTAFVYDGGNIILENTGDNVVKYLRGFEIIRNSGNIYYTYNGQGDVAILKNAAGAVVADYTFDAFGNMAAPDGNVYNPFGYRGEYQDLSSGLVYLRNRYYDPSVGRFISEDPIRDGLD